MKSAYVVMKQRQSVVFMWEPEPDRVFQNKKQAEEYSLIKNEKATANHYWVSRVPLQEAV